ncbi:MAG: tyrosine-type recombinase/integrase [Acidimicrobiales bacterium]|jgi:site-specific recombinase XerD
MTLIAPTLEAFFTERLARQKQVSPQTVAAYRDAIRLLLGYLHDEHGITPCKVRIEDLDAEVIVAFLDHLEANRHNGARTRNARLAAIRSLFSYASLRHPDHAALIQRVLAIPQKRFDKTIVPYLTQPEVDALLSAPDRSTWEGRRDVALLAMTAQTGLRVSELVDLNCGDLELRSGAHLRCRGKGRKERVTPLTKEIVAVLNAWLDERCGLPEDPLFPARTGRRVKRGAIERRVAKYRARAIAICPSMNDKRLTPHVLRHTAAMQLLQAGVDATVIALWLGHSDVRSTQAYLQGDLTIKESALARVTPTGTKPGRYRPPDPLLAFLEGL